MTVQVETTTHLNKLTEEDVKNIIASTLNEFTKRYGMFYYSGYFLYNRNHPGKWLEFDVATKINPLKYKRESCVCNNDDPDVILSRKITDAIHDKICPFYQNRDQTRITIYYNENFKDLKLDIEISE